MKNRATQRRTPVEGQKQVGVKDYFFRELGDGSIELRQDNVTRAELWGALEFYHNKSVELNAWWRVLGRLLRRKPGYLNPFKVIYVARIVKPAEKKLVGVTEEPAKVARKTIDASGKVVEA